MANNVSCIERTEYAPKNGSGNMFLEFLANGFDMNLTNSGENSMGAKVVLNFGWRKKGGVLKNVYYIDIPVWCNLINDIKSGAFNVKFTEKLQAYQAQDRYKYADASTEFAVCQFEPKGTSANDLIKQKRARLDGCAESRRLTIYPSVNGGVLWHYAVGPGSEQKGIIVPFSSAEMKNYEEWRKQQRLPENGECLTIRIPQKMEEFKGMLTYVDDVRKAFLQRQIYMGCFDYKRTSPAGAEQY